MGKIMELFYGELGTFQAKMEDDKWEVEFRDEKSPPLFKMTPDGQKTEDPACIQVIGTPDMRIITTGRLLISKKRSDKIRKYCTGLAAALPARIYAGAQGNGGGAG